MIRNQVLKSLILLGMVSSVVACSANKEKKDYESKANQMTTEKAKYESLSEDLSNKLIQLQEDNRKLEDMRLILQNEREEFAQQKESREEQIIALDARIKAIGEEVAKVQTELKDLEVRAASEKKSIEAARKSLEADKTSLAAREAAAKKETSDANDALTAREAAVQKEHSDAREALNARETLITKQEEQLALLEESLRSQQSQLKAQESAFKTAQEKFAQDVVAARELFLKEGAGDVFDGLQADKHHNFLVTVRGFGSVKNILDVRKTIGSFNVKNNKASLNQHSSTAPVFAKAGNKESIDPVEIGLQVLQTVQSQFTTPNHYIYNEGTETTTVKDAFIISGTASDAKKMRDEINKTFQSLEGKEPIDAISVWVMVRPVRDVRASLNMSVLGSNQTAGDARSLKEIYAVKNLRPVDAVVDTQKEVDLTDIESLITVGKSNVDLSKCKSIDRDCLVMLKKSGLLDGSVRASAVNSEGKNETIETTDIGYLERLIEISLLRIDSEKVLIGDNSISTQVKVRPPTWFESWYKDFSYEIDSENIKAQLEELKTKVSKAQQIMAEPIVEKLVIRYSIRMVDKVSPTGNPLDTFEYMDALINGGRMFKTKEELQRGEIEIDLPIITKLVSESKFEDLTLSDVKIDSLPTPPTAPSMPETLHSVSISTHNRVNNVLQKRAYGIDVSAEVKGMSAEETKFMVEYSAYLESYNKYSRDMDAYRAEIKKLSAEQKKLLSDEYFDRLDLHSSDLRSILRALRDSK